MMMTILDFFPTGKTPRKVQVYALTEIERLWHDNDVLILDLDVGGGKSDTLQTVARWRASMEETSATLTPRVTLQEQYKVSFPDVTVLQGKARYKCQDTEYKNCFEARDIQGQYCPGCKYVCDRDTAKKASNGVFSIHSYLLLNERKDNLLIDEAHTLYDIMSGQMSVKLWKHKVKYPNSLSHYSDVIVFLEKAIIENSQELEIQEIALAQYLAEVPELRREKVLLLQMGKNIKEIKSENSKFSRVLNGIRHAPSDYFVEHIKEKHRGMVKSALQVRPTTLEDCMGWLWPKPKTKKVILASGSISEQEVTKLGLSKLRVSWIRCLPAIPFKDRPIKLEPAGNMSYKYLDKNIPNLAAKIDELRKRHDNTKGIVHCTYSIAQKLQKVLKSSMYLWHTPEDKEDKLQRFLDSPPGTVFIASGMSEGIDLAGPDFGWQALCRVSWPSKADKLISHWYENDPDWVSWLAARETRQACGRINRYPGDVGTTYLLDLNFKVFLKRYRRWFPDDFHKRIC